MQCGRAVVANALLYGWPGLRVAGVCTFGNVGQYRLIHPVCRTATKHKATIAIPAIDIAVLINLKIDARMAKAGSAIGGAAANLARAVTADTALVDKDDFGWRNIHGICGLAPCALLFNRSCAPGMHLSQGGV